MNVELVEGEAEHLPFQDESFDVVISNGVIDLIPDKDAVFSELHRARARELLVSTFGCWGRVSG